ncbi:diguanylate cyclase domain-containing protein [Treponema ruminis]|uniref:diguanylate cyclase n=1 Tax=Treponema ruminis TaxID=744515 RepID=A0A7W8G8Z6_9SPIR|nr:diguanylate cyclase [Treponema ruminis]MBB5226072.1 diguanylate cyclase (GGDEF)-like protein [Treponema ruminis]
MHDRLELSQAYQRYLWARAGKHRYKKLCRIVCLIFAHSPVFRIGGDEFVVILENSDFDNADSLLTSFKSALYESQKAENEWERVSAAAGIATYDPAIDTGVESVFKRADMTMYENKKHMKAVRTD